MVGSLRTPLLCSVTVLLAASAPRTLPAQRAETPRRAPRAEPPEANDRRLRRLGHQADSLAQLYNDSEELTAVQRRAVGEQLDRTVAEINQLTQRMDDGDSRMMSVRVQVAPMMNDADVAAMRKALWQAQASQVAMPRGWLGIVVSGTAQVPRIDNGELIIRYLTYPEIVSVEPSSPAERAGLIPSDTLVAYDGRDVRDRDISLTKLLRPNARVVVRVRRDGRTKEVPVTIADVPSRIRLRSESNMAIAPEAPAYPLPPMPLTPRMAPMPRAFVPERMSASAVLPPQTPTPGMIRVVGYNSVAGAQFAPLTEGLARSVGVARGVLVISSAVGSPAYESGLRDGDVVVRAGGMSVSTVLQLREAVQRAVDNGETRVDLDYVRERKARKLTLHWHDR